jgi:hypothetical protein
MLRLESFEETNAPTLQSWTHRRVKRDLGTRNIMAAGFEKPGERTHSGPGNTYEMHVHGDRACHNVPVCSNERRKTAPCVNTQLPLEWST